MRVAVIGLGLIGGSIALAARERLGAEVTGWDADAAAIEAAVARGAIASGAGSLADAVAEADVVFTAAPVDALVPLIGEALTHARPDAVVTDVGSTKRTIVDSVSDPRFIGGHPLAGAETSGVQNASADLFEGSTWYLTPGVGTADPTVTRAERLVDSFGATAMRLDPTAHDRLMAVVSHLPHVFANVLISQLLATDAPPVLGPSFRDATRVAGSNPAVWSAIFLDNREQIGAAIEQAVARLEQLRGQLQRGEAEAVRDWCEQAASDRQRLVP